MTRTHAQEDVIALLMRRHHHIRQVFDDIDNAKDGEREAAFRGLATVAPTPPHPGVESCEAIRKAVRA